MGNERAKKIGEWLMSDDTGLSSKYLAGILLAADSEVVDRINYPHDPSDFGRCLRLVRLLDCRDEIEVMSYVSFEWDAVVRNWDRWAELYDQAERTDGKSTELYWEMVEALTQPK